MIEEVMIKSHLIITGVHDEYHFNWCGKIMEAKPLFKNNKPIFVIVGTKGRIELNTTSMVQVEDTAKRLTYPKGRSAITTDTARVYIKEIDGNEKILGVLTHNHIKDFAPMFDAVGYKN